jgi:hypothetical protein
MTDGKLALLRLAHREFVSVSASAEMLLSNGIDHEAADGETWVLLKKMAKIQTDADKIAARLEVVLEKYADVEVSEIY